MADYFYPEDVIVATMDGKRYFKPGFVAISDELGMNISFRSDLEISFTEDDKKDSPHTTTSALTLPNISV